jgi:hypothetical protein
MDRPSGRRLMVVSPLIKTDLFSRESCTQALSVARDAWDGMTMRPPRQASQPSNMYSISTTQKRLSLSRN